MEQMLKPCELTPRHLYVGDPTCAGDKFMIKAKLSVDPVTGQKIAEPGEKVDLDAIIQSYAGSTDIVSIITRLQSGDTSVINVRQDGFEGDLVNLPRNVNDMVSIQELSNNAYSNFQSLPDEFKALFDYDPAKFFDAVLTNKIQEIKASFDEKKVSNNNQEGEPLKEGE